MRQLLIFLSLMLSVLSAYADEAKRDVANLRNEARLYCEKGDPYHEMQARHELYQALWTQNPDSARIELERFNHLKDSLYHTASKEQLAKYNAEFGNDQLQEENYFVSRSRNYIIIISIMLLGVGCWVLVRQRRLIALQKKRLSEDTKTLEELQLHYENQQQTNTDYLSGIIDNISNDIDYLSGSFDELSIYSDIQPGYGLETGTDSTGHKVIGIIQYGCTGGNGGGWDGDNSFALGYNSVASRGQNPAGFASFAFGARTTANGTDTFAAGDDSHASGRYSVAIGYTNIAQGHYSLAMGSRTSAFSDNSVAIGIGLSGTCQTTLGIYNEAVSNVLLDEF